MINQEQLIYNLFQAITDSTNAQYAILEEMKKINTCLEQLNKKIEMATLSGKGGEIASQTLAFLKGLRG